MQSIKAPSPTPETQVTDVRLAQLTQRVSDLEAVVEKIAVQVNLDARTTVFIEYW